MSVCNFISRYIKFNRFRFQTLSISCKIVNIKASTAIYVKIKLDVILTVLGEDCTFNDDCHATTCAGSPEPICEHEEGAGVVENGGLCTCAVSDGK